MARPKNRTRRTGPRRTAIKRKAEWQQKGRPLLIAYNRLMERIYGRQVRLSRDILASIPGIGQHRQNTKWIICYLHRLIYRLETYPWPDQPKDAMAKLLDHYVRHWDAKQSTGSTRQETQQVVYDLLGYLQTAPGRARFENIAQAVARDMAKDCDTRS